MVTNRTCLLVALLLMTALSYPPLCVCVGVMVCGCVCVCEEGV